jgi:hypothetical protein
VEKRQSLTAAAAWAHPDWVQPRTTRRLPPRRAPFDPRRSPVASRLPVTDCQRGFHAA